MKVTFYPDNHIYLNESSERYISVTTLIGLYKKKKDWNEIAARYAKKHGYSADYWLKEWGKIKDLACEVGSKFHDNKEKEVKDRGFIIENNKKHRYVDSTDEILNNLKNGIHPERLLWNHEYKLAGTADKVIIENGFVDIDDYKTNKSIDKRSFYNRYTNQYDMMEYPLNDLMDCNYTHYGLQINIYMFMLDKIGYNPRNLSFRWHKKDQKTNTISNIPVIFPIKYKPEIVKKLLDHYKSNYI